MPKRLYAALLSGALVLASAAGQAQEILPVEEVLGDWLTGKQGAVIELYECAGSESERPAICGRIVWLKKPYTGEGELKRDPENPDKSLRQRPMCGLEVVTGLRRSDENTWTGGRVYNPKDGNSYSAYLDVKGNGRLHIRGYLGIPLIGKSETWTRPGADIEIGCPPDPRERGAD